MTRSRFPEGSWKKPDLRADRNEVGLSVRRTSTQEVSADAESHDPSPAFCAAEMILSSDASELSEAADRFSSAAWPCGVFVPENYEPNYAYPLIIWLHDAGSSDQEFARIFPQISPRNYMGLAIQGMAQQNRGDGARLDALSSTGQQRSFEEELHSIVGQLRQGYHIHSERIFIAGAGTGASAACDLFFARPEWFGGAAILNGAFPEQRRPLRRFRRLQGKSVFLAAETGNGAMLAEVERAGRLLYAAGLEVTIRNGRSIRGPSRGMLRALDHWIMRTIGGCL